MIGATIVLTAVYWLSDLAVAMWMGGLLMVSLLLGLPLGVSPDGDPMRSSPTVPQPRWK